MADEKVRQTQEWLNVTYGNNSQWRSLTVDGQIGWMTVFGLIRGLQIELGISTLSDSFGDTTFDRLATQFPFIVSSTSNANVKRLAQSALWCQGYTGGYTWGTFDAVMNAGLKSFSFNIGLTSQGEPVANAFTPKMVKALMTLDSYTLLSGGVSEIREAQRWLNGKYRSRKMPFMPCDGFFTRSTQQGLVTAVQYELGMTDSQANGYFGSGTRNGLTANGGLVPGAADGNKSWVRLLQCSLRMNGYSTPLTGTFNSATSQSVQKFKSFAELPGGATVNFATWASLLISTGDELRAGTASDMSTPLTAQYCSALSSAGYRTVGRYLSVNGKRYQPGELARIFAAGLATFPIMQEDNTFAEYFGYSRGKDHGFQAVRRLRQLGFKDGNTVFFAVDFDPLDDTITSRVIPYFRGVRDRLAASSVKYRIGVYGTRNVCARLVNEGYADEAFVASMSWGWGGNLGYPLPPSWSYDQIRNHTLDGTNLEIDTNIQSSRANPAGSQDVLPTPLKQIYVPVPGIGFDEDYFWYLTELSTRIEAIRSGAGSNWVKSSNTVALHYLAFLDYNDAQWEAYAPSVLNAGPEFESLSILRNEMPLPPSSTRSRLTHWAASTRSYLRYWNPPWPTPVGSGSAEISDLGGWGLDLAQAWQNLRDAGQGGKVRQWVKTNVGEGAPGFGREDLVTDVDAYIVASKMGESPQVPLSEIVRQIEAEVQVDPRWRYRQFVNGRFGGSFSKVTTAGKSIFTISSWGVPALTIHRGPGPSDAQSTDMGRGLSDVLRKFAGL
ncbi:glycoside hydrolase domain-containing protein [Microbacterium sp. Leaf179]|uniref:glycoside hydrolase domain-containing protein n=1 Tax=Microbacterium sp. Leaf179 TaxID=1736288 RepID=UPI000AACDA39|nr:glycoside hydrolase domain-containing protein [Microbacterium sp. Leaf179]